MSDPARITAVLSMLHEPEGRGSAGRLFRGRPVLAWTLDRIGRAITINSVGILCWDDQCEAVRAICADRRSHVMPQGPRTAIAQLDAVSAARRWADGWRGGLLGACEFDRGFHAPSIVNLSRSNPSDAFLLIDPAAALVDPVLLDALVAHAAQAPAGLGFIFSPAAPGLSGVLVRPALLDQLASARTHPGRFIGYMPDSPCPDPLSQSGCCTIPTPVARTTHRFTLDSDRQVDRISAATSALNGQLITTGAAELVARVEANQTPDAFPREIVLELTTRRATRAVFRAGSHLSITRADLSIAMARQLFQELGAAEDVRLTLAGVGDPLLAEAFIECVTAATEAGIRAIHVETDLLGIDAARIDALAAAPIDVISIHLPALTAATYLAVMGVDGCATVLQNVRRLVERRHVLGRLTPLLVPVFTKCPANLGEMELWYDKWLKAMGSAVIGGPSDFAAQIPDHAVADMAPPRRRPCARLASRLTILSDGTIVACEQDVLGRHAVGRVGEDRLTDVWMNHLGPLRADHANGRWGDRPLCAACHDWHRP